MTDDETILSLRFNQDNGCFACCMENGVKLYNTEPTTVHAYYGAETIGSISICEMLFRTNLLAMVAGGSNPKYSDCDVMIYDDKQKKMILRLGFPSPVKAVRFRIDKIVVATINEVHVFSFPTPTEKLIMIKTTNNPRGLLEITAIPSAEKQVLIFPGFNKGSVQIMDIKDIGRGSSKSVWINAHQSDLVCLALNKRGTLIATASSQGTLVRVWNSASRQQLVEFRRGSDSADINCLSFSINSDYLCCSSDKGTVHVFAISNPELNKKMAISRGFLGKCGESMWGLTNITVATESKYTCAFSPEDAVIVLCEDGTIHRFIFTEEGESNRVSFNCFLDVPCHNDF